MMQEIEEMCDSYDDELPESLKVAREHPYMFATHNFIEINKQSLLTSNAKRARQSSLSVHRELMHEIVAETKH